MASRWHAYMPPRQPPRCVPLLLPPRSKAVELAALPDVSPEQRRRMLQFVICGGGPTGVETAAELMDLVSEDLAFHMPHIKVRRAVQSGGRGGARRVGGRTCGGRGAVRAPRRCTRGRLGAEWRVWRRGFVWGSLQPSCTC